MENTLCVAKTLNDLFMDENGTYMDEMRMHKMMYLCQRESLLQNKNILYDAEFEGWSFGPVLQEIKNEYLSDTPFKSVEGIISEGAYDLVQLVYERYKGLTLWKLSTLIHGELSWKSSREGLDANENGSVKLELADMKVDAAREYLRRKKMQAYL